MQVEIITEGAFFSLKKSQVTFFAVSVHKNRSRFEIKIDFYALTQKKKMTFN